MQIKAPRKSLLCIPILLSIPWKQHGAVISNFKTTGGRVQVLYPCLARDMDRRAICSVLCFYWGPLRRKHGKNTHSTQKGPGDAWVANTALRRAFLLWGNREALYSRAPTQSDMFRTFRNRKTASNLGRKEREKEKEREDETREGGTVWKVPCLCWMLECLHTVLFCLIWILRWCIQSLIWKQGLTFLGLMSSRLNGGVFISMLMWSCLVSSYWGECVFCGGQRGAELTNGFMLPPNF